MKDKMNYLERVSFAFKHGKDKAKEEFSEQDESIEEKKKKRKMALAFYDAQEKDDE